MGRSLPSNNFHVPAVKEGIKRVYPREDKEGVSNNG